MDEVSLTGGAPASATEIALQRVRLDHYIKAGAGWFLWIAILSLVNSAVVVFGGGFHFILGLGITQVVDAVAKGIGEAGIVLDLIINGFVAAVFVLFWSFGKKAQKWAFVVGMIVYLLDGLLLLAFKDILSVAFHAYALYMIYRGYAAVGPLAQLERAAGAAITPQ